MPSNQKAKKFWQKFCLKKPEINPETPFQIWFFGNSPEVALSLGELVLSEKKTATASLVAFNEIIPELAPVAFGLSVITDFEGNPLCILQTTEIRHLPFDEVDAKFAADEGEGDLSLKLWRAAHYRYFSKEAAELKIEFTEKSIVCCERFKVLYRK